MSNRPSRWFQLVLLGLLAVVIAALGGLYVNMERGPLWTLHPGFKTRGRPRGALIPMALSPDGYTLALGSKNGSIILVDTEDGYTLTNLSGGPAPPRSLFFSPDGFFLLTLGEEEGAPRRHEGHEG